MLNKFKKYIRKISPKWLWKQLEFGKRWCNLTTLAWRRGNCALSGDTTLKCLIAHNRNGAYCIPYSSIQRPVPKSIINGNVWEQNTLELILNERSRGDIVHAGAFFGDFLPFLSKIVRDKEKIIAFEPNFENYRCTQVTCLLNSAENVEVYNYALGAGEGVENIETKFIDGSSRGGASRIVRNGEASIDSHPVKLVSLDSLLSPSRSIGLIQLDVEGFEADALKGAEQTIKKWRPLIILESVPNDKWFLDILRESRYSQGHKVDDNMAFFPLTRD